MIGRRSFLKVMGIGTAAAPLAAKAAAEQEIANLTQLRGQYTAALAPGTSVAVQSMSDGPAGLLPYVRQFGFPAHIDQFMRDQSRQVFALDPDIACKKSWSLNVKIQTQRERNYQSQVDNYFNRGKWAKAQAQFKSLTGLDWHW